MSKCANTGFFTDRISSFDAATDAVFEWNLERCRQTSNRGDYRRMRLAILELQNSIRLDREFGREVCTRFGVSRLQDIDAGLYDLLVACRAAVAFHCPDITDTDHINCIRTTIRAVALSTNKAA